MSYAVTHIDNDVLSHQCSHTPWQWYLPLPFILHYCSHTPWQWCLTLPLILHYCSHLAWQWCLTLHPPSPSPPWQSPTMTMMSSTFSTVTHLDNDVCTPHGRGSVKGQQLTWLIEFTVLHFGQMHLPVQFLLIKRWIHSHQYSICYSTNWQEVPWEKLATTPWMYENVAFIRTLYFNCFMQ